MPTYEFECPSCKIKVEEILSIKEDLKNIKCPKCETIMTQLLSAPAFHLKGTGWYVTDYAKTNKKDKKKIGHKNKTD